MGEKILNQHIFAFLLRKSTDKLLDARLTALLDFLHHPWFERVWIVQEAVVGPHIIVQYGSYVLAWEYLLILMDILNVETNKEIVPVFQHSGNDFISRPLPLGPTHAIFLNTLRKSFHGHTRFRLVDALRHFAAWQSSNPRDKIFALLGLTDEMATLGHIITYDKNVPVSDILFKVAEYFYQQKELLSVLQFAGIGWGREEPNSPSWVVNWTKSFEPTSLAHSYNAEELQYKAATQVASHIVLKDKHLIIRGKVLDRIKVLGSLMEQMDNSMSLALLESLGSVDKWIKETTKLAEENIKDSYHTGQSRSEVLWRTLIGDRSWTCRPAEKELSTSFSNFTSFISKFSSLWTQAQGSEADLFSLLSENGEFEGLGSIEEMQTMMAGYFNAPWISGSSFFPRKVAVMEEGWFGMVPERTREGDVVCLMYGAQVPFMLRPVELEDGTEAKHTYALVGECYVHGVMDGEGLKIDTKVEDFKII